MSMEVGIIKFGIVHYKMVHNSDTLDILEKYQVLVLLMK
jgi:hypothetical protein